MYQHILVGVDLTAEACSVVLKKAQQLAQISQAKLSLAHVVEPLVFAYAGEIPMDLADTQEAIGQHAKKQLAQLAEQHNIQRDRTYILHGSTASKLHECATDENADLLVVGSRGRHGLALIFGSTASDVIHGAQCDVLALRV